MANQVYANNMEVACKSASGKSTCAFPDVCFTPPQTPATPPGIPIPYPNTGMASDTTDGSRTVMISGQEVMLKNKSYFKKSTGDEAGNAPKKGVITSRNTGKVYFNAWSMDVKVEGENVVRHLDLTTHNHASPPGNTPTWPYLDEMAFAVDSTHPCKDVAKALKDNDCQRHVDKNTYSTGSVNRAGAMEGICNDKDCKEAMKCVLTPKSPSNCCAETPGGEVPTPHHIVPDSQFHNGSKVPLLLDAAGNNKFNYDKAPCICAQGRSHSIGMHGRIHGQTNTRTRAFLGVAPSKTIPSTTRWPVAFSERIGAEAVQDVTGCDKECTQAQLREGHQAMGIGRNEMVRPTTAGAEAKAGGPIPMPG
ncbi:MAG: hypothetical protein JWL65_1867 [Gammaproteobacteria bacterium]|nr:hypothetical protein [Gammaproteobacteria bacterium]